MAFRLLHIMQHSLAMRITDNAPKVGRRLVANSCAQNHSLCILLLCQSQHLFQREGATDVRVEHEESIGTTLEDGIAEVIETSSGAEGLVFAKVADGDLRVGARAVFDEVAEDGLVVVADDEDFADFGDFGYGGEAVRDDGVAGDFKEGLGWRGSDQFAAEGGRRVREGKGGLPWGDRGRAA